MGKLPEVGKVYMDLGAEENPFECGLSYIKVLSIKDGFVLYANWSNTEKKFAYNHSTGLRFFMSEWKEPKKNYFAKVFEKC